MKPADEKVIQLKELRFKPANSNDAARAVLSHHFSQVPKCSFAKDDGISQYIGSETGMDAAPASPREHVALHDDVPAIATDTTDYSKKSRFKLLREAFAAALLLHAVAAAAILYVQVPLPPDDSMVEGVTVVSLVVEGAEAELVSAGEQDAPEEPVEEPVEVEIKKPVGPVKEPEPVQAKTEDILKDVPMPALMSDVPEILTALDKAEAQTEVAPQPVVEQKQVEEEPVKELKAAVPEKTEPEIKSVVEEKKPEEKKAEEKQPEPKKEEPKKKPEKKEKPVEKRRKKGNQADALADSRKGANDSKPKGEANNADSRGASNNRELGNAARSNYKGIVQKKLQRAKSRVRNPGKGSVVVSFTITAGGDVSGLRLAKSSGNEKIDAAAMKIVSSAAPFPAIPAEAGRKTWPMSVPIQFK